MYKLLSAVHYQSIIEHYGMPPAARPPDLPVDVVERVIRQSYIAKNMWNGVKNV